jgi:Gly-Xaa carboxypeptidase
MAPITLDDRYHDEKAPLGDPAVAATPVRKRPSTVRRALRGVAFGAFLLSTGYNLGLLSEGLTSAVRGALAPAASAEDLCPQAAPLVPGEHAKLWSQFGETLGSDEFRKRAVEWLGGAVRVPTESYDSVRYLRRGVERGTDALLLACR